MEYTSAAISTASDEDLVKEIDVQLSHAETAGGFANRTTWHGRNS